MPTAYRTIQAPSLVIEGRWRIITIMWPSPEPCANASQKPMTALETARGWGGMEYTFRS
jgi:hypothetical protein